jgi:hypothetical protein
MLSNKRFQLTTSTLAIDPVDKCGWITIPAGAILSVVAGPNGGGSHRMVNRMVNVDWEGRRLSMFAIDLTAGIEITDHSASA